jgi:hypothetical protein
MTPESDGIAAWGSLGDVVVWLVELLERRRSWFLYRDTSGAETCTATRADTLTPARYA